MTDPLIGKTLANFHVERLLGQGGMATVYYGLDVKLHRPVAIKVLDKRYKNHPAYAARFVNEARMMAKWRHENIVQIYYADDSQGFPYYAMEHVDGEDLGEVMTRLHEEGGAIPAPEALRIGKAVAGALDYAHRHGVVHRDVKPSNILLSKDGRVLLGDFGMALEVRDGSQGHIFGTPHYISPEQAKRSADAVPQSDIYSLGVILYEILTGSVPFNDPSPATVALLHISEKPPAPRSLNPNLPAATETVLLKALEKDARERYQTGAKLMEALEDSLAATGSLKKNALPPLPVGVPTVQRSESVEEKYAKRKTPSPPIARMPATVRASAPARTPKYWLLAALVLLLGIGAFLFAQNGFFTQTASPAPTASSAPPSSPNPVSPTQTEPPAPTAAAATTLPATATLEPTPTIPPTPTILYPEGSHYTLFYNETSFYILNRSFDRRSIAGFAFQRLDEQGGVAKDHFEAYQWETASLDYLPRNNCANITIYGDQEPPYLNPAECWAGIIKTVQARFDRPFAVLFWTPKTNSTQFRVLWADNEVARCDIAAGLCEVYIP